MSTFGHFDPQLLSAARLGDHSAQAKLLQAYQSYLLLIARVQINRQIQRRVSPSDVVQSVLLQAHKHFADFRGESEVEFAGWLRRILASQLVSSARRHLAQRRDARLEQQWDEAVNQSSTDLASLVAAGDSPSQVTAKREQSVLLAELLNRLPSDYREIIVLRHLEEKTFPDIAAQMQRTVPSVKCAWARAVTKLRLLLTELES